MPMVLSYLVYCINKYNIFIYVFAKYLYIIILIFLKLYWSYRLLIYILNRSLTFHVRLQNVANGKALDSSLAFEQDMSRGQMT